MQRRQFLSSLATVSAGGGLLASATQSKGNVLAADLIDPIAFDSTSSLLDASGSPLTDETIAAVWGEQAAKNTDTDGDGDAVNYGNGRIPLVAVDGNVAGIGTPLVPNDTDFGYGAEEFLLNLWDELIGGGTVLWDESHDQFYQLDSGGNGGSGPGFAKFEAYAKNNGYDLRGSSDLVADLSDADAVVVTTPRESFTQTERSTLSKFVDGGGTVILHSQSDFRNYDSTDEMNAIASALGVGFRFNDDQVVDATNNTGSDFVPTTTNFNLAEFSALFQNRAGIDEANALDPTKTYTVDVVDVADGDTVDVQFDDGRVESVRVLGVDTAEKKGNGEFERPEEWEGLADRVGLQEVVFDSTCSLLNGAKEPLTDDTVVAVTAESSAYNVDSDGNGDSVSYPNGTPIPLVAIDGQVAGLGAPLADDDTLEGNTDLDNEELLLNVWDRLLGGSGTVRWDESHGQFYDLASFSTFESYAERNGYTVEPGSSIPSDTTSVDGLVVTSPGSFSSAELSSLSSFVADGGAVILHNQSDYNDFDQTANLDAIAAELGVGFRFNDDQVQDDDSNAGVPFVPTTTRFDPAFDVFAEREGLDEELVVRSGGTPVERIGFGEGTASLLNASGKPLTDNSLVAVHAESTATNTDSDGNGDAVSYPDSIDIPVVAIDGQVAAIGGPLINDGQDFGGDNEEFVLNVWDRLLGGSGTVRWDESHGQFYDLASFSTFESYAERNGYTVEPGSSIPSDTTSVDGLVVTSPGSFSSAELSSLSSFVADGGAVILHDQSDFSNFDQTTNLNAIAAELGVGFRFNDDQVLDSNSNLGSDFQPATRNVNDAAFPGLFQGRTGVDDVEGFWNADYPYLAYHARLATQFARDQLQGETVDIYFDQVSAAFNDGVKDPFGRVLAYIDYDATGDGTRDDFYNGRLVANGYARSYASSLSRLEELLGAELSARDIGKGVWRQSNPELTPEIRNDPVEEVYVPKAVRVTAASGSLGDARTVVYAADSASPAGAPVCAIDRVTNVAILGGLLIDETYEKAEDFAVDTSGYGNFPLVTNVVDTLTDRDGPILVSGGQGQFNAGYALSGEDIAYYQRFLEGVDIGLEGINDLTADRLNRGRALVLTTPVRALSDAELSAVRSFADAGGAVVLATAATAPKSARGNLNAVAERLGSDLRATGEAVTDGSTNLNGDATLPVTSNFSPVLDLYGPYDPGTDLGRASIRLSFSDGPAGSSGTAVADVVLSEAPSGLSDYEVTITVADTGVATVAGAGYPDTFESAQDPSLAADGSAVTLAATDSTDRIGSTQSEVTLASVEFAPEGEGITDVSVSMSALDDDDGTAIDPLSVTGSLAAVADVAPVVENLSPTDGSVVPGPSVTVTGTVRDGYRNFQRLSVSADGGTSWTTVATEAGSWRYEWSGLVREEDNVLLVQTIDTEGNRQTFRYTLEREPPQLTQDPIDLPDRGSVGPPQDINNDGQYMDINGDGGLCRSDRAAMTHIVQAHQAGRIDLPQAVIDGLDMDGDDRLTNADIRPFIRDPDFSRGRCSRSGNGRRNRDRNRRDDNDSSDGRRATERRADEFVFAFWNE